MNCWRSGEFPRQSIWYMMVIKYVLQNDPPPLNALNLELAKLNGGKPTEFLSVDKIIPSLPLSIGHFIVHNWKWPLRWQVAKTDSRMALAICETCKWNVKLEMENGWLRVTQCQLINRIQMSKQETRLPQCWRLWALYELKGNGGAVLALQN